MSECYRSPRRKRVFVAGCGVAPCPEDRDKHTLITDVYSSEVFRIVRYSVISRGTSFNRQIGSNGWTSSRSSYLATLYSEFEQQGFDYLSVGNQIGLSLANNVEMKNIVMVHRAKTTGLTFEKRMEPET